MTSWLMRSLLFVPGHDERLLASAAKSKADVLLLDIEDSVPTIANKQLARKLIREWVEKGAFKDHLVFPRVNDRESGQLLMDVHQLTIPGVRGFMYPKSKKGEDVYFFAKLLETIEYEKGIPVGTFKIIPIIETTAAVLNAQEICQASERVVAIAYGCEDFIADLGGIHDAEGKSLFTARSLIAMAARANNVLPIDTVHINVHDLEDLENNLITAKEMGFEGMLVLHPKELPLVHRYFTPTEEEVKEAETMLKMAAAAEKDGKGVAYIDGKFIGPPMVRNAQNILKRFAMLRK
ncbi:MAG: CoA ester lyase [Syntrophaceae bacterium]|nr:CoA ester lyase [Syntrophaceae bacterium]